MTTEPNRQQGQYPGGSQYPPPPDPNRPQEQTYPPPTQWAGPPPGYQYPDPSAPHQYPYPPPGPPMHHPLQPQHPDPFRLPPPPPMYPQHPGYPPVDPYRPPPHMAPAYNQPAPRQRTAIACRYCRRRKIRCSGYESEHGKCSNCVRFGQECLFTPVSSSAQAFVPAHVAYPQLRNQGSAPQQGGRQPPTQLYGAHGQPLPPDYAQSPQPGADPKAYPPPSAQAGYSPYAYPPISAPYDDRGHPGQASDPVSRKRPRLDDSMSQSSQSVQRAPAYPDPTNIAPVSPATSASSYQTGPPSGGGYYPSAPPSSLAPRSSPQSAHSFDNRASGSPHGSISTLAASSQSQPIPGRTPPPTSAPPGGRPGMSVAGMLGGPTVGSPGDPNGSSRSTHDNDMLNALDRRNRGSGDERK